MMDILLDIVSWIFLVSGSFFCLTGAVGLLRFPEFFSRIHAASLTDTLGASLILIGLMFPDLFVAGRYHRQSCDGQGGSAERHTPTRSG
jgi:multisubunit Na+/H+ antiporter MnhG subunit